MLKKYNLTAHIIPPIYYLFLWSLVIYFLVHTFTKKIYNYNNTFIKI